MLGYLAVENDVATDCFSDFFKLSRLKISGYVREKSWKCHGILFSKSCGHPVKVFTNLTAHRILYADWYCAFAIYRMQFGKLRISI